MEEKINKLIESLSSAEKDLLYRKLWVKYVEEDVEGLMTELGITSDHNLTNRVATRYAFNGDYDCELSYWANLENLIEQEK